MDRPTTEKDSHYNDLEHMSMTEIVTGINEQDSSVAASIHQKLDQVSALAEAVYERMNAGGRLFYIGSGTSGRLGIVDASECPPTFGVPHGLVIGIIAGGDGAIRKAVEKAEDDLQQAWLDLKAHDVSDKDFVVGISASGKTPYVLGGLKACKEAGIGTGSIACNINSPIGQVADCPVEVEVGPEFVTGSTRMKAGTAQKMILNMLTTGVMIKLGRVKGNKMVDMQLSNDKLVKRGTHMVMEATGLNEDEAQKLLLQHGSVRKAVDALKDRK